jgi:hypothetical protein
VDEPKPPPNLVLVKARAARGPAARRRDEIMADKENELYDESASLLRDLMFFGDIDPDNPPELPPQQWVKEVGVKRAERRFRLCQEAWKPASRVASGVLIAKHVFTMMHKAKSDAKRPRSLNVQLIQMNQPPRVYPEIDVSDS